MYDTILDEEKTFGKTLSRGNERYVICGFYFTAIEKLGGTYILSVFFPIWKLVLARTLRERLDEK